MHPTPSVMDQLTSNSMQTQCVIAIDKCWFTHSQFWLEKIIWHKHNINLRVETWMQQGCCQNSKTHLREYDNMFLFTTRRPSCWSVDARTGMVRMQTDACWWHIRTTGMPLPPAPASTTCFRQGKQWHPGVPRSETGSGHVMDANRRVHSTRMKWSASMRKPSCEQCVRQGGSGRVRSLVVRV